jgi:hypothetical protein
VFSFRLLNVLFSVFSILMQTSMWAQRLMPSFFTFGTASQGCDLGVAGLLFWLLLPLSAQEATQMQKGSVRGNFLADSMQIGEPIYYSLSFEHPADWEVIFPDSTHAFKPFEWVSQQNFPTQTQAGISRDSAVYVLRSFEMDTVQNISVPVWVLRGRGDTLVFTPPADAITVRFQLTPELLQDSSMQKLQTNTDLVPIEVPFNYPMVLLIAVAVLFLVALLILLFGGRVRKAYRLRRLRSQHERFVQAYLKAFAENLNSKSAEQALAIWKNYLENLEEIPYTTYTSSEIVAVTQNDQLKRHLKALDRAIYGSEVTQALRESLDSLLDFAVGVYENRVKEVRNV